jgi:hypothetical protein
MLLLHYQRGVLVAVVARHLLRGLGEQVAAAAAAAAAVALRALVAACCCCCCSLQLLAALPASGHSTDGATEKRHSRVL